MTKNNNTKKSLVVSVLSMVVCLAMLIGATFAWFSDSVVSGDNQIVAGNLDIELTHKNAGMEATANEEPVTNATVNKLFKGKDASFKWEPGAMVYENFTVNNMGSLAAKYRLQLTKGKFNTVGEGKSLKDVLKVAIIDGDHFSGNRAEALKLTYEPITNDIVKEGTLSKFETEGSSKKYAMIVYWEPSNEDNAYNINNGTTVTNPEGITETGLFIDLGVKLDATQHTVESDSFDDQYDREAALIQEGYECVTTAQELNEALQDGGKIVLGDNITTTGFSALEGTIIDGNGKTINGDGSAPDGNLRIAPNVEYRNITFKAAKVSTKSKRLRTDTSEEDEFKPGWGVIVKAATFKNCTFNETSPYLYPKAGEDIVVENCTFIDTLLQICYNEGNVGITDSASENNVDPATKKTVITGNTFVVNNYNDKENQPNPEAHAIVLAGGSAEFWANGASTITMSGNTFSAKYPDDPYIAYYIYGKYLRTENTKPVYETLTSIPQYNQNTFNGNAYYAINSTAEENRHPINTDVN